MHRSDIQALNSRRAWIIEQLTALIRNGAIPKTDSWILRILDWLIVHGLFVIKMKSDQSTIEAVSPNFCVQYETHQELDSCVQFRHLSSQTSCGTVAASA
jgi:hypothetical protein